MAPPAWGSPYSGLLALLDGWAVPAMGSGTALRSKGPGTGAQDKGEICSQPAYTQTGSAYASARAEGVAAPDLKDRFSPGS